MESKEVSKEVKKWGNKSKEIGDRELELSTISVDNSMNMKME